MEAALADAANTFAVTVSATDPLLSQIDKLTNLRYLYLDKTIKNDNYSIKKDDLAGFFTSLSTLKNLQYIAMYDTKLLEYVSALPGIKAIQLSDFNIATFDKYADKLGNLEILIINDNKVTALPNSLAKLKNLKQLEITSLGLSTLSDNISELSNLRVLKCLIGAMKKLPENFGNFKNLQYFDLGGTPALKDFPLQICSITSLKELYINLNGVNKIPEEIGNLTELRVLYLHYAKDIKKLPMSLSKLSKLEKVYISQAADLTTLGGLNNFDHDFVLLLNVGTFSYIKDELATNNHISLIGVSNKIQPSIIEKLQKDLPQRTIQKMDF